MTISARKIVHACSPMGQEIWCVLTRYPRFIHSEVMTHRVFSRNASSSRAIPVLRLLKDILHDPAMPIHWGKNQPGMQAKEELSPVRKFFARNLWLAGMYVMVAIAWLAHMVGAHKQIVNRLVEPWSHINVLITATEWGNFFELRDHPDAQPEIRQLAIAIREAFIGSYPEEIGYGEWITPFVDRETDPELFKEGMLAQRIACSVARCARTSYMTHEGKKPTIESDLRLYNSLVVAKPMHASPAEHQATPDDGKMPHLCGNFDHWQQHRKHLEYSLV